ncbi:putative mitochondrial protein, conserved [Myotisia sp. PD_48]|nr:putative mitochondrial protein, conserved [Myotisia sp. PD_48]
MSMSLVLRYRFLPRPSTGWRCLSTSTSLASQQNRFPSNRPSPPRLPKEDQEIFEELQSRSTGAFSSPIQSQPENNLEQAPTINASGKGEELHPDLQQGAKPEFEGEVNPKTGEVGGPKNEPLRWGAASDWSYNGRVTDF